MNTKRLMVGAIYDIKGMRYDEDPEPEVQRVKVLEKQQEGYLLEYLGESGGFKYLFRWSSFTDTTFTFVEGGS